MKEVLTIQVSTWQMIEVKGKTAEAGMILFDGFCDCENFKGRILPGGVDTQKSFYPEARSLSARYILEGTDRNGKNAVFLLRITEPQTKKAGSNIRNRKSLRTVRVWAGWKQQI